MIVWTHACSAGSPEGFGLRVKSRMVHKYIVTRHETSRAAMRDDDDGDDGEHDDEEKRRRPRRSFEALKESVASSKREAPATAKQR